MSDDLRLIFANAKVYRLEREISELTECRDAVAAGARYLRKTLDEAMRRLDRKQAVEDTLMNYIEVLQNKIDEMQGKLDEGR